MHQYLDLAKDVITNGEWRETRNGNRLTVYGRQLRFDLRDGFPILTTKRVWWKGVVVELLWFLRGDTNIKYLHDYDVHIWDANADAEGNLAKGYGWQWRFGFGVDQIARAIRLLEKNPTSTRIVVTAWNPADLDKMVLPPCHMAFQLHSDGRRLWLQQSQRSVDLAVGLPFNISSYALLTHIFAKRLGLEPMELIMDLGNVHIYEDHVEGIIDQIGRKPLPRPELSMSGEIEGNLWDLRPGQFQLIDYEYLPQIKFDMVV